jgi:hypothetical protein
MSEEIETAEEAATATATGIRVETPEISVDISRYPSSVMLRSLRERFLAVKVTVESPPMEKIIPDAEIRSGDQVVPKDLVAGARFKVLPQPTHGRYSFCWRLLVDSSSAKPSWGKTCSAGTILDRRGSPGIPGESRRAAAYVGAACGKDKNRLSGRVRGA